MYAIQRKLFMIGGKFVLGYEIVCLRCKRADDLGIYTACNLLDWGGW